MRSLLDLLRIFSSLYLDYCNAIETKYLTFFLHSSCSFGKKCEFLELKDMMHGFLLEGDRSVEAIAVTSRVIMKQAADFLDKFVRKEQYQSKEETWRNKYGNKKLISF